MFTDKPNTNKILLMKYKDEGKNINGVDYDEVLDAQDVTNTQLPPHITQKLSSMNEVPKNKADMPQTSNQEIGWFIANGGANSKFVYPRKGCNETGYADDYYTMKHYSPFSNKNK